MLKTGDYKISFYNKYGARLKGIKKRRSSHTDSLALAEKFLKKSAKKHKKKPIDVRLVPVSYAVDRRVFDSLAKTANF